ncbi:MAG: hypothetical protein AVDCRST_MAG55-2114, partial [uncultured Rubrobacteraceae bacterium]
GPAGHAGYPHRSELRPATAGAHRNPQGPGHQPVIAEGDVRAAALPEGHLHDAGHLPFYSAPEELAGHL